MPTNPGVGRNDPCYCDSGKKYKKCCMQHDQEARMKTHNVPYMLTHAVDYPIFHCFIGESEGMAVAVVTRMNDANGLCLFASYVCDTYLLGVKDTMANGNLSYERVKSEVVDGQPMTMERRDYEEVRSLVLGGRDYAAQFGFLPHKDWELSKHMVEPDSPYQNTCSFGEDGKPCYIQGPYDNAEAILKKLRPLGESNYHYVLRER